MIGLEGVAMLADRWLVQFGGALIETAILVAIVLAVTALGRRVSSQWKHALLLIVLLKFVTSAIPWQPAQLPRWRPAAALTPVTQRVLEPLRAATPRVAAIACCPDDEGAVVADVPGSGGAFPAPEGGDAVADRPRAFAQANAAEARHRARPTRDAASAGAGEAAAWIRRLPLPVWLMLAHSIGSAVALIALGLRYRRLRRLVRRCRPSPDRWLLGEAASQARLQGLRRPPSVLVSPDGFGPAAVGCLRPTIVLPAAVTGLPRPRIRPILAHEIAHHRRRDVPVNAASAMLGVIWWFHPAFWIAVRQLRRFREDCCDELVLLQPAMTRETYCECLLDVARAVSGPRPALAAGLPTHPLARRIERMMTNSFTPKAGLSRGATAILAALALFVLPGAGALAAPPAERAAGALAAVPQPAGSLLAGNQRFQPGAPGTEPTGNEPAEAEISEVASSSRATAQPSVGEAGPVTLTALPVSVESQFWRRDWVRRLSDEQVDSLVRRGLDRGFVEEQRELGDRTIGIQEARAWVAYGVDAGLLDELGAMGTRELEVGQLLQLVWSEVDGQFIRDLRDIGYDDLDLDDIITHGRYDIDAAFVTSFRDAGYPDLDLGELVTLRRYDITADYARGMADSGFNGLDVEDLVTLSRYDVEVEYVTGLAELGYGAVELDEVVTLKRYDVDLAYVDGMSQAGAIVVEPSDLVTLKRYDVEPDYVVQLRELGYEDLEVEELVRLKRYEVDTELIAGLGERGYDAVSVDDLVTLDRYDVDLVYVDALQSFGMEGLDVEDLVTLQRYEVDAEKLTGLAALGYSDLEVSQLVTLHRYDVELATIEALRSAGYRHLSVEELVQLRRYEVTPEYIGALAAVGWTDLPVSDLIQLKRYEVDAEFIGRLQAAEFEDLTVERVIRLKRAS